MLKKNKIFGIVVNLLSIFSRIGRSAIAKRNIKADLQI